MYIYIYIIMFCFVNKVDFDSTDVCLWSSHKGQVTKSTSYWKIFVINESNSSRQQSFEVERYADTKFTFVNVNSFIGKDGHAWAVDVTYSLFNSIQCRVGMFLARSCWSRSTIENEWWIPLTKSHQIFINIDIKFLSI